MLDNNEAKVFLSEVLNITDIPACGGLPILNQIIQRYHEKIPFQSISLLAQETASDLPSLTHIKEAVLSRHGGLCYTNNVFMLYLLQALGYAATAVAGACNPAHPNNHIAVIVRNVQATGDSYLVDVGCGSPTFQAVPLDFVSESPIYKWGFLACRFQKVDDEIIRFHAKIEGQYVLPSHLGDTAQGITWQRYYNIDLAPQPLDYFYEAMKEVYTDRFLKKFTMICIQGGKMFVIKDASKRSDDLTLVSMEMCADTISSTIITDVDAILKNTKKLVPYFDDTVISMAIINWQKNKSNKT